MNLGSKRLLRQAGIIIGLCVVAAAIVLGLLALGRQHKDTKQAGSCTVNQPCLKLTAGNGQQFVLNDFRFLPNHCVSFISLPDNVERSVCGNWHLDWIGPAQAGTAKSQVI